MKLAASQLVLLQRMCRDVTLLGIGTFANVSRAILTEEMALFEANQKLLVEGGTVTAHHCRLAGQQNVIAPSTDASILAMISH